MTRCSMGSGECLHVFGNALGHRDGKLIAFPPDHLDQDRKLELAASHHLERIGGITVDLDGHIVQEFLFKPLPQMAGSDVFSFLAGKGRRIDRKDHGDGGLIHRNARQRLRVFKIGDRVTNTVHAFNAGQGNNIPTVALSCLTRFRPSNAKSDVILVLTVSPLWVITPMASPTLTVPAKILPMARRPT